MKTEFWPKSYFFVVFLSFCLVSWGLLRAGWCNPRDQIDLRRLFSKVKTYQLNREIYKKVRMNKGVTFNNNSFSKSAIWRDWKNRISQLDAIFPRRAVSIVKIEGAEVIQIMYSDHILNHCTVEKFMLIYFMNHIRKLQRK